MSLDFVDRYTGILEEKIRRLPFDREPRSLYEPCRYVMMNGGKRFRPMLTLIASGLCGGDPEQAVPAALSVELLHNFTLVHDDIMDDAPSRRGLPSVHVKWDLSTAILAGDLLFAEAFAQLTHYDSGAFSHTLSASLKKILLDSTRQVCEGQARDLEMERSENSTTAAYQQMIEGKTAALVSGALKMGGVVAGAGEEEIRALEELGRAIGVAFQIQDDLLDVTADPEKFGKTRGGDILEGKKTWLLLDALEQGNEEVRTKLSELYRKTERTPDDVELVIRLFNEAGTIERVRDKVKSCYLKSDEILDLFVHSSYKEDLVDLLKFLKNRDF